MSAPRNPDFAAAIRESFARQGMMGLLEAELASVAHGAVTIAAPIRPEVSQQQGFSHAGLAWTIGDSAAGYAALSVMDAGVEVMSVEMKINLLAPGKGRRLVAEGRVLKPGRRLVIVAAEIWGEAEDGARTHVATMLGTMIPV